MRLCLRSVAYEALFITRCIWNTVACMSSGLFHVNKWSEQGCKNRTKMGCLSTKFCQNSPAILGPLKMQPPVNCTASRDGRENCICKNMDWGHRIVWSLNELRLVPCVKNVFAWLLLKEGNVYFRALLLGPAKRKKVAGKYWKIETGMSSKLTQHVSHFTHMRTQGRSAFPFF